MNYLRFFEEFNWDYIEDDEQLDRLMRFSRENHKEIKTKAIQKAEERINKKEAKKNWTKIEKEKKRQTDILNRKKASDLKKSIKQKEEIELNEFKILVNNFTKCVDTKDIEGCISNMKEAKQLWKELNANKFNTPFQTLMKKLITKYNTLDINIQNQIKTTE